MPEHSRIAEEIRFMPMLKDLLVGNNKKRLVSATVLLIIAFLIHVKNKRPDYEPARNERREQGDVKKKKVQLKSLRAARATSMPSSGPESKNL
jgi:hypothetical protein